MASLKRIGCLLLAVVMGGLLFGALTSSLAWASAAEDPYAARSARLGGAARWLAPQAPDAPGIVITKTVGTNPGVCATTDTLAAPAGSRVIYCYTILNTGTVTLITHTLRDNRLGQILTNFTYSLAPGASAFITQAYTVTQNVVNTAVWTATAPSLVTPVSASDRATVTVIPLTILLTKTVGISPHECATTPSLYLPSAATVTYCYEVTNTGPLTMTHHALVDSRLGNILTNFPFALGPGASAFLTQSAPISLTTTNVATWTARSPLSSVNASAVASATVWVGPFTWLPTIRR